MWCSQFAAGIGELPTPAGLADTAPVVPFVVGSQLFHAALLVSFSYDTCHKPFQVPQVPAPISQRIFRPYSDRRAHTDDKFVAPAHSLGGNHQGPTHGFGGEKGFQLNYRPYSSYWPYSWRC